MKKALPLDLRHLIALELNRCYGKKTFREHELRQLFWECTLRCNLKCRHCGSDCKTDSVCQDMPLEDFLKVLDSVASEYDSRKVMIIMTGGEPLLRKDLEECGKEFNRRKFPWGMVTNGFALTRQRLDALMAAGLHSVTVSLDGLEEEHDWMRNVPGSFRKASEAIRMISETDLAFDVVTCVNRKNFSMLGQIKDYLIGLGLKRWRLFTVFPAGRAASDPDLIISGTEFRSLMEFIKAVRKEGKIEASYGCEGFLGNYEGEVRSHFFKCLAGISIASVLADGSISACPSIRADYHQGNIYHDDFISVWKNRFGTYRDHSWMKTGECADCRYFRYCQGSGMHLRDSSGKLMYCHLKKLTTP